MASPDCFMDRLSNELLLDILSWVHSTSPNGLLQTALVSRRFHALATDVLFNTLDLIISPRRLEANIRLFRRLEEDPHLCKKIQGVAVADAISTRNPWQYDGSDDGFMFEMNYQMGLREDGTAVAGRVLSEGDMLTQVKQLAGVFPKLTNIKSMRWRIITLIPLCLYDVVNSRQGSCTLEMPTSSIILESPATLSFFRDSKCLSSIALSLCSPDPFDESYDNIQEILRSCLGLKRLSLSNYEDYLETCSMLPSRMKIPFRPLDELRIDGYELEPDSEELWDKVINWSRLQKVGLEYSAVVPLLSTKISSLRSLSVSFLRDHVISPEHVKQLMDFAYQTNSLEEISFYVEHCHEPPPFGLPSPRGCPWSFGQSLRSLSIIGCGWPSHELIHHLGQSCPQLRSLSFSLLFEDESPLSVLHPVAVYLWFVPKLSFDVTWIEVPQEGCLSDHPHVKVSHFWSYIWKRRDELYHQKGVGRPGSYLKSLDVSGLSLSASGLRFWRREVHKSFALVSPGFHREGWHVQYQKYQIRLSERDDEASSGMAMINCQFFSLIRRLMLERDLRDNWLVRWIERMATEKVVPNFLQDEFNEVVSVHIPFRQARMLDNYYICDYFHAFPEKLPEFEKTINGEKGGQKASAVGNRPLRQRSILEFFVSTREDGRAPGVRIAISKT